MSKTEVGKTDDKGWIMNVGNERIKHFNGSETRKVAAGSVKSLWRQLIGKH